jgi:hypothetical protein
MFHKVVKSLRTSKKSKTLLSESKQCNINIEDVKFNPSDFGKKIKNGSCTPGNSAAWATAASVATCACLAPVGLSVAGLLGGLASCACLGPGGTTALACNLCSAVIANTAIVATSAAGELLFFVFFCFDQKSNLFFKLYSLYWLWWNGAILLAVYMCTSWHSWFFGCRTCW